MKALMLLMVAFPIFGYAGEQDIEEPDVVLQQKVRLIGLRAGVPEPIQALKEEIKPEVRVVSLAGIAPDMAAISIGEDTKVLHAGDRWQSVLVESIDTQAMTATLVINGTSHVMRLTGYSAVEITND